MPTPEAHTLVSLNQPVPLEHRLSGMPRAPESVQSSQPARLPPTVQMNVAGVRHGGRDLEDLRRFLVSAGDLEFVVCVIDRVRDAALDDFTRDVPRAKQLLEDLEKPNGEPSTETGTRKKPPQDRCRRTRAEVEAWIQELRRRSGVTFALAWRLPGDAGPSLAHSADMTRDEALWEISDILDFHSHGGVSCLP